MAITFPQVLIDAGNSRVKAAMLTQSGIGQVSHWPHEEIAAFAHWLDAQPTRPLHAWLVSVASDHINAAIAAALNACAIPATQWQGKPLPRGFVNAYRAPTLGPDRLLAAIGARQFDSSPVLVVASFGTATTVDLVQEHVFRGGLIAPGVRLMAASLNRATAHLPMTEGKWAAVPDNTHDAIFSGICAAQRGLVTQMLDAAAQFGAPQLIVSGGAAHQIAPVLPAHKLLPHAVLTGLAHVASGETAANA
jgi:type III pantothenate kinase